MQSLIYIYIYKCITQAFVSEYAVWREDAGNGSFLSAVAEAAFLIGLEKNRLIGLTYLFLSRILFF